MSRFVAIAATALVALTLGGAAATAAPVPVPGPKQPIERLSISGGLYKVHYGDPGCFTGKGNLGAAYAVPAGATLLGATVYATDILDAPFVSATLNNHSLVTGSTSQLAQGFTKGKPGTTTLELVPKTAVTLGPAEAINISINVSEGTCFKGAEVRFIRGPVPVAPPAQNDRSVELGPASDGSPAQRSR